MRKYVLDVMGKSLGRSASEAAAILRGKNEPDFSANAAPDVKLVITNIEKVKISPKKLKTVKYKSYSGYPGGLKETSMKKTLEKKGMRYIFERTVKGMLPKNKLRALMIKNIHFE